MANCFYSKPSKKIILLSIIILISTVFSFSQEGRGTGRIKGTVVDEAGNVAVDDNNGSYYAAVASVEFSVYLPVVLRDH